MYTSVEPNYALVCLIGMKTNAIPSRLRFWVVDKLDTTEMKLRVRNGVNDITLELIHSILGLPMDGFYLMRDEPSRRGIDIAADFRKQFPTKPMMRPMD